MIRADTIGKVITLPPPYDGAAPISAVFEQEKLVPDRPQYTGLAALLRDLPLSAGTDKDVCLRLPGKTCASVSGTLAYWAKRWKWKFRRQQTNQGVRIWRIR